MPSKRELVGHFAYLDGLRESGVTNMYGAASYLMRDRFLGLDEARLVLSLWMKTFDGASTIKQRVTKATASPDRTEGKPEGSLT